MSELDLRILQILEFSPTIPVKQLAENVGTSWITANRHIEHLRESGILSNSYAVFDPGRLGLVRHVVFFTASSETQVEKLEMACDLHPYTHYRARIYGPSTGLFTQFDIPLSGTQHLSEFLEALQDLGFSSDVQDIPSTGHRVSTPANLERFDSQNQSWNYDWNQWPNIIDSCTTEIETPEQDLQTPELSSVELGVLRDLTSNADISQREIQEKYSVSQSTASRKMALVEEQFIESIRARIDRSRFDVTSTKLFFSTQAEQGAREKLFNALQREDAPPFPLSIDLLDEGALLLWGRMPPTHEHNLFYALWRYLPEIRVFTMDTVGNHSSLYWFYPENYDLDRNSWKVSKEWMVTIPLDSLKRKYPN